MANSDPGPEGEGYLDKGLSWDKRLELARARRAKLEAENGPTRLIPKRKPWEEAPEGPAPVRPDQPLPAYPGLPPERQAAILARMRGDAAGSDPAAAPARKRRGDRPEGPDAQPDAGAPAPQLLDKAPLGGAGRAKRLPEETGAEKAGPDGAGPAGTGFVETGARAKRRMRPAAKAGKGEPAAKAAPARPTAPVGAPPPERGRAGEGAPQLPETRRRTATPPSVPRPEVARQLPPEPGPLDRGDPGEKAAVAAVNRLLAAPPEGDDPRQVYGARFASIPPAAPKRRRLVWLVALACLLAGLLSGVLLAIALFFSIGSEVRAPHGLGERMQVAELARHWAGAAGRA